MSEAAPTHKFVDRKSAQPNPFYATPVLQGRG